MYAFTNQFCGQSLRQRIQMMNRPPSTSMARLRCPILLFILLVVALGCQLAANSTSHKYIQSSGDVLFSVITAQTSDQDLDTLRRELAQRDIDFKINQLTRLASGNILQLALDMRVPKPGHPISVSIGSAIGEAPIQPIGLRCEATGCQLTFVDNRFPKRLTAIALSETPAIPAEVLEAGNPYRSANVAFGLYQVFFRNDFLESNYFGLRNTAVRMTSDYHLDLYPEFQKAIVFLDGHEISRKELAETPALDLKKVVVFTGEAAMIRLGDVRARHGLVLLSRLQNISIRDKYAATSLLKQAYPELFAQP